MSRLELPQRMTPFGRISPFCQSLSGGFDQVGVPVDEGGVPAAEREQAADFSRHFAQTIIDHGIYAASAAGRSA
jgi:hypothetical protein